jgi:leucyl aminopeptidase (aminopeptidase T)
LCMTRAPERFLLETASKIVVTNLAVKAGESFITITDVETFPIGYAFFDAGLKVGAEAVLAVIKERTHHGQEPPEPVTKAWAASSVYIVPTKYSLTHTQARKAANKAGARGATMPGITESMFKTGAITADYSEVSRLCEKMGSLMDKASRVRVTSDAGTDITMSIKERTVGRDTGLLVNPGESGNLPAGEVWAVPAEESAEGTLVFDGSIASVGVLKNKVTMTVQDGFATKITGGPEAAKFDALLAAVKKRDAYNIAELGVGCNPNARLVGIVLEDEKVYGTVHVALGDNSALGGNVQAGIHLDGIILNPNLFLDGKVVIEKGVWVV